MLYNLEPDQSVTGGPWYSASEFESEFVEILNAQAHKFLQQRVSTVCEIWVPVTCFCFGVILLFNQHPVFVWFFKSYPCG